MRHYVQQMKIKTLKFLLLPLLVLTLYRSSLHAENSLYVSPGLSIGMNSDWKLIGGAKISLGINTDSDLTEIAFYNITFGFNALISPKSTSDKLKEFNYIQIQAGKSYINDDPTIFGAGIGFIFNTDNQLNYSPILSLFSGFILFPELDLLFLRNNSVQTYFKIRAVAPYALRNLPLK